MHYVCECSVIVNYKIMFVSAIYFTELYMPAAAKTQPIILKIMLAHLHYIRVRLRPTGDLLVLRHTSCLHATL